MKIAILTPTRGRPDMMCRFIRSVLSTASGDDIYCYNYIDDDDTFLSEYQKKLSEFGDKVITIVREPQSVSKSWNVIAEQALRDGADIFIMGNDDLVYRTEGWDVTLKEKLKHVTDNIYCAWFEDKINSEKHCAFPIVSRKWVQVLGYFTPGVFEFGYNDTWVFDIGKKLERLLFIPEIVTEHLHASLGKSPKDETFLRNRETSRGNLYNIDKDTFNKTDGLRGDDAAKLEKVMDKELSFNKE